MGLRICFFGVLVLFAVEGTAFGGGKLFSQLARRLLATETGQTFVKSLNVSGRVFDPVSQTGELRAFLEHLERNHPHHLELLERKIDGLARFYRERDPRLPPDFGDDFVFRSEILQELHLDDLARYALDAEVFAAEVRGARVRNGEFFDVVKLDRAFLRARKPFGFGDGVFAPAAGGRSAVVTAPSRLRAEVGGRVSLKGETGVELAGSWKEFRFILNEIKAYKKARNATLIPDSYLEPAAEISDRLILRLEAAYREADVAVEVVEEGRVLLIKPVENGTALERLAYELYHYHGGKELAFSARREITNLGGRPSSAHWYESGEGSYGRVYLSYQSMRAGVPLHYEAKKLSSLLSERLLQEEVDLLASFGIANAQAAPGDLAALRRMQRIPKEGVMGTQMMTTPHEELMRAALVDFQIEAVETARLLEFVLGIREPPAHLRDLLVDNLQRILNLTERGGASLRAQSLLWEYHEWGKRFRELAGQEGSFAHSAKSHKNFEPEHGRWYWVVETQTVGQRQVMDLSMFHTQTDKVYFSVSTVVLPEGRVGLLVSNRSLADVQSFADLAGPRGMSAVRGDLLIESEEAVKLFGAIVGELKGSPAAQLNHFMHLYQNYFEPSIAVVRARVEKLGYMVQDQHRLISKMLEALKRREILDPTVVIGTVQPGLLELTRSMNVLARSSGKPIR